MTLSSIDEVVDKLVVEGLNHTLFQMGFNLNKKRRFQKKVGKCTLELNVHLRKIPGQEAGYVEVCPAIVYNELEKLAAELEGEKPRKGWPTAAANIGNLKPDRDYTEWPITTTTDIVALGEIVSNDIIKYAVPFWDDFRTIDGLITGYLNEDPRLTLTGSGYNWQMAAAYCLIGNKDRAQDVLKSWNKGRPPEAVLERAINMILKMF